jgi:hypothetical protein
MVLVTNLVTGGGKSTPKFAGFSENSGIIHAIYEGKLIIFPKFGLF